MPNRKKKLIAIASVCLMALSSTACTDKQQSANNNSSSSSSSSSSVGGAQPVYKAEDLKTASLSPEEVEKLKNMEFEISEFIPPTDVEQDPIEQDPVEPDNSSQGQSSNSVSPNNGESSAVSNSNSNNDNSSGGNSGGNNNDSSSSANNNDSNSNANNNDNSSNANNNDSSSNGDNNNNNDSQGGLIDNGNNTNDEVIVGTKKLQQAFWMNLSGNFVFDGEYMTAQFKIKDTTANGTYPILIEYIDFSDYVPTSLDVKSINGSVVVGGNPVEKQFANDGSFEVKADSVSGNPGDTVTVSFQFKNNPGVCATIFRFSYDSDALEYVGGAKGADFVNALNTQNK